MNRKGPPVLAVRLALGSSLAYGCSDFLGGLGARRAHVLRTVMVAAPVSLAVELLLWPLLGATWSAPALGWGAASGLASAAAFALLYRTLAIGPMSVLSPVSAVVSAALPVGVGLALGEHLGAAAVLGIALALVAVVLVAGPGSDRDTGPGHPPARPGRSALLLAVAAGTAIALQLVCLDRAPTDSGLAPLITGRAVSSVVTVAAALLLHRRLGPERPSLPIAAGAGALDSLANLAFLLAVRSGDLAVVAVITALYPAGTVLLARTVLAERLGRAQLVGLGTAAASVCLLALG
jgi:drug/metabolite transporter (DMT)-like permease